MRIQTEIEKQSPHESQQSAVFSHDVAIEVWVGDETAAE